MCAASVASSSWSSSIDLSDMSLVDSGDNTHHSVAIQPDGHRPLLAALELRLALLRERPHALPLILGGEERREEDRLVGEAGAEVALQRAVRRVLRRRERDGRALRERGGRLEHTVEELGRRIDGGDEPDPQRLGGVDRPPGKDQVLGERGPDRARKPLRPAPPRDDGEVDLRLTELRVLGRVANVAGERELAAPAQREAVHGRERRLRHRLEQAAAFVTERAPRVSLEDGHLCHLLDVRPGGERLLARAGENDDPRRSVGRELAQPVAERLERLVVQRVERVGPVDRDDGDAVDPLLDADAQAGTFERRNSTISLVGAPGVKTAATPCERSSSASSAGIVPPTTTSTSSAPFSRSPSRIRGTSVMCAPERIEIPTASASSWIAVSTICSGVWWRPV